MKKSTTSLLTLFAVISTAFAGEQTAVTTATPAPDKSRYTLFNPTPLELRRAYNTDRSSKTDSPYSIDAGVFQIEADAVNYTYDREDGVRVDSWIVGNVNFKLGLTNWMDLQVFPQFYVYSQVKEDGFGTTFRDDGFGDTTVRLKFNLVGNEGGKFVLGLVTSVKTPTNSVDFLNDEWEPGVGLPFNYSLPGGFTLFGQTRIDVLDDPVNGGSRVQWQNPIGISRTIVGNLSGYLEFFNAVSLEDSDSYPWIGTIDVGLTYQVSPNFSVDVNSYFGVTDSAPDYNVFIGFGRRF